jgi:hypothetical protein
VYLLKAFLLHQQRNEALLAEPCGRIFVAAAHAIQSVPVAPEKLQQELQACTKDGVTPGRWLHTAGHVRLAPLTAAVYVAWTITGCAQMMSSCPT